MADSSITNVYKILGGVTMGHFIGMAGGAIGGSVGYYLTEEPAPVTGIEDVPPKAFYGSCLGAGVGHAASIFMGHHIAKTPDNKPMGNAQMVFSGIGIALAAITAGIGHYILEETPQLASLKVIAPVILIGKSPGRTPIATKERSLGVPKTETERKATHLDKFGTTDLPVRGTGLN